MLSVLTFRTPEEAIEKANNTPYGLSAGVWTEKGSRIFKMIGAMKAGVVWANTFNRFDPTSPVRRLQGVRLRARGRRPRPGRLPRPVGPNGNGRRTRERRPALQAPRARRRPRASVLDQRAAQPLATTNGAASARAIASACGRPTSSTSAARSRAPSPAAPYEVFGAKGELLANACRGTRKDIRDAVRAARKAQPEWAAKTAYNRSQILYRIAELMEGRRDQFVAEVIGRRGRGRAAAPARTVDAAIDRWVWYAGWADKYPADPRHREPGRRLVLQLQRAGADRRGRRSIAPEDSALLGLVSRLAPVIVSGNAAVVIASRDRARCRRSR